jgi:signal transduction histidine kinase
VSTQTHSAARPPTPQAKLVRLSAAAIAGLLLLLVFESFLHVARGGPSGLDYALDVALALFMIAAVVLLTRFASAKIRDAERSVGALGQAEARLVEVTDGIPGAVYQFESDEDGTMRFPFMSSGVEALYGVPAALATAEAGSMFAPVAEQDLPLLQSSIAESRASLRPWLCEYRIHLGAEIRWIRASSAPTRVSEQTVRWNGVLVDISAEKALEAQLARSQKMEAVGQLTGGLAHDFNNLLTVIIGNGEELLETVFRDGWEREALAMILAAAERGAALNESLLAFGRRQALDPGPIDVNAVVSDMEPLLRHSLGEQILVRLDLAPKLAPAYADRAQLESALLNLAVNARDAMPKGGRLVIDTEITLLDAEYAARHEDVRPGEYVSISVDDTGEGIAPEVLARVFEPFFTTKDVGKGSGLGLSQVYGFAKQSNGHLSVYSEVGHGTAVRLYLPVSGKDGGSRPPQGELEMVLPSGRKPSSWWRRRHGAPVRGSAAQQPGLSGAGGGGWTECGPHPGVRRGRRLVFTDLVMPNGMSGRDVAEAALRIRPA